MDSIRSREARRQLDVLRVWRFGTASLDEATLELTVDGHAVALERKALEVLLFLLHHAGEFVTKAQLVDTVWPARRPTDAGVARCIATLRRALDDHDRALIETIEGRGYRLNARVQVGSALPASLLPDSVDDIAEALR